MVKEQEKPKTKQYYDVRVLSLVQADLTYRVLAETPQQAAELIKNIPPSSIKPKLQGKKDLKISVYRAGQSVIEFIKNIWGR
jgi:hypothetical protein